MTGRYSSDRRLSMVDSSSHEQIIREVRDGNAPLMLLPVPPQTERLGKIGAYCPIVVRERQ
jgi:hypothetical protein